MTTPNQASYTSVLQNSTGQIIPGATVIVLSGTVSGSEAVNTSTMPGTPLATIYSDPYGASPINQSTSPLVTDDLGNFTFWAAPGYYVLQIYGNGVPGQIVNRKFVPGQIISGISLGAGGTGTFNTITVSGGGSLSGTFTGNPTFSGNVDFSGSVIAKEIETVLYADQFPGSDIGAKINNAIAALPTITSGQTYSAGIISLVGYSGQSVTQTTTVNLNSPWVSIIGPGSGSLMINYTGTGDAFRATLNGNFSVTQAGQISGFYLNGNSNTNACGIHYGDIIGLTLEDLVISNFTGTASAGLWCDNVGWFTERTVINKVHLNYNNWGWLFTNSSAGGNVNNTSMAYNKCMDLRLNVGNGQIGIYQHHLSGNTWDTIIYHGFFNINANFIGASKTFFKQENSTFQDNQVSIFTEDDGTGGTWLQNDSSSVFYFYGNINNSPTATPMTNSISGQFQQQWSSFIPGANTTFTTGGIVNHIPDTPATSGQNINSQPWSIQGNYWNGSQSAQCGISHQITYTTGTNPTMQYNLTKAVGSLFTILNAGSIDATFLKTLQLESPAIVTSGSNLSLGNATTTTATSGSATLPGNPLGFIEAYIGSTLIKIPYYSS